MKISELINNLRHIMNVHGDLPVTGSVMDEEIDTISILDEDGCELGANGKAVEVFLQ